MTKDFFLTKWNSRVAPFANELDNELEKDLNALILQPTQSISAGFQSCPACNGLGFDCGIGVSAGVNPCPVCQGKRIISMVTGLPPFNRTVFEPQPDLTDFAKSFSEKIEKKPFIEDQTITKLVDHMEGKETRPFFNIGKMDADERVLTPRMKADYKTLDNLKNTKQFLFRSDDNVDIYAGDPIEFLGFDEYGNLTKRTSTKAPASMQKQPGCKYFSKYNNAEQYLISLEEQKYDKKNSEAEGDGYFTGKYLQKAIDELGALNANDDRNVSWENFAITLKQKLNLK